MVQENKAKLVELAAEIVAAYVGNNPVPQGELPRLIGEVYRSLEGAVGGEAPREEANDLRPAITVKKSVTPEFIICLEDGKKFKSLKRHLRSHYNMSPEQYREKWKLPADYPMVASQLRRGPLEPRQAHGLGQRRKGAESSPPTLADRWQPIHLNSCADRGGDSRHFASEGRVRA